MKKLVALFLALVLALAMTACAGQPAAAEPAAEPAGDAAQPAEPSEGQVKANSTDPIVVGVYGPLSGDSAMVGQTLVEGVELATKQINEAGGIYGRQIELITEDDAQNPATAVSAVNKLVHSDSVAAVIGTVNSSCTLASMEVTQAAGIPHITPISSGAAITQMGNPYIVRIQASDLLQAGGIAKYAIEDLGAKKVACLYQSDDYGTGAMEVIVDTLKEAGMELVANEAFDAKAMDMTPQLLKVKEAGADALIMYTMYQQGALIATQARQMGIECPLLGGGGLTNAKLYELGGESVIGLVNTQTFFADADAVNEVSASFIKAFEEEYGRVPDSNNAMAYDSMLTLAEGLKYSIEKTGDVESDLVMEGMHAIKDMDMATGNITIDENGDAVRAEILKVRLIGENKYELVK